MIQFNNMPFIGRKDELTFFNRAYSSQKAELIVLYGRRRVGKTELLKEFCKDKPHIFYICRKYTDAIQLDSFSKSLLSYQNESYYNSFKDWDSSFNYINHLKTPHGEKLVLVIDEFPYACTANKSLPSILQIVWDNYLSHLNIMIILCGSSMSFMEDELLSEKNPLYGRATGIYKLDPMPYYDAIKFVPYFTDEEKIITYAILGGIPHYLKQFDSHYSLKENIINNILTKGAALYSEADFMLYQELRETSVYNSIIQAIALGCHNFNEILQATSLEKTKCMVYLKKLIELHIVSRDFSVLSNESDVLSASKGVYNLVDSFFNFWFKFAYPNLNILEMGDTDNVWSLIEPNLHSYASFAFEKVCIDYMYTLNKLGQLPFRFTKIGRWWGNVTHKNDNNQLITCSEEIDILAFNSEKKQYIQGECKFRNTPFNGEQLEALKQKLSLNGEVFYYLFSLNGFTKSVYEEKDKNDQANKHLYLIDIKNILSL